MPEAAPLLMLTDSRFTLRPKSKLYDTFTKTACPLVRDNVWRLNE